MTAPIKPTGPGFFARMIASAIALASPEAAARYLSGHIMLQRAYAAAKTSGPNQNWKPKSTSANAEIVPAWRKTTDRARDLGRNNPYVAGAVKRFTANTVGEGMWPKCKVLGSDGKVDADLARKVELAWEEWQEQACANGDEYVDLQRLAAGHVFIDGEILIHRVSKAPLLLEAMEADHLDTSKDTTQLSSGGSIVGGIELDRLNRPVAYWVLPKHPGDQISASTRIPASEILHIFDRQRASQVRGISMLASVVTDLFETVEYQDATMILARVATAYGIFVESASPEDLMPADTTVLGDSDDGESNLQYVNPGGIHYLRPGEKISTVKAEQPGDVYAEFIRSRLRAASAGSGMSYETFSNDYSQTNYSSSRQALIQERAMFRYFSGLFDRKLNRKIYRWWMDAEVAMGRIPAPGYARDPRPWQAVKFSRPRQEWIDPAKEAVAAERRLALNLDTLTDLCEAEGRDIDEVLETRSSEIARMKALGLMPEPALEPQQQEPQPDDQDDATPGNAQEDNNANTQ